MMTGPAAVRGTIDAGQKWRKKKTISVSPPFSKAIVFSMNAPFFSAEMIVLTNRPFSSPVCRCGRTKARNERKVIKKKQNESGCE